MTDVSTWTPTSTDLKPQFRDESGIPRPPGGITEFGERYGVYTPFLPFGARDYSPLERLSYVRTYVEHLTDLKPAFTSSEIANYHDMPTQTLAGLDPLFFYAVGSRPLERQAHKGRQRYANPEYIHKHTVEPITVTDPAQTLETARKFARMGYVDIADIADYFDRSRQKLGQHLIALSAGESYQDMREVGRRAMGRTWHIIREWDPDCTQQRIADAFGVSPHRVNNWIRRYARETSFEIPDDPTSPGGFRYIKRYGEFRDGTPINGDPRDAVRARQQHEKRMEA